jgi:alcohol dehydrogenase class IV
VRSHCGTRSQDCRFRCVLRALRHHQLGVQSSHLLPDVVIVSPDVTMAATKMSSLTARARA